MLFSEFIEDTLAGNNDIEWNYYNSSFNTRNILSDKSSDKFIKEHFGIGEKKLPLILNPYEASHFIEDYFDRGSKSRALWLNVECPYKLPDYRASHTVSCFFLGLLIEKCINSDDTLSIVSPDEFSFIYIWFLTCLYHDYAYCIVEREDSPIHTDENVYTPHNSNYATYMEYKSLEKVKQILGITVPLYPYYFGNLRANIHNENVISLENALLRELTKSSCRLRRISQIRFNNDKCIKSYRYNATTIVRYFNYRKEKHNCIDHGIIGGYLFYDRIIKNYIYSYLAELHNNPIPKLDNFEHNGLRFSQSQLPVFSYIADCISVHNIWKKSKDTHIEYEEFALDKVLGDDYKIVTYDDNPLLFVLAVADTLEPTKIYSDIKAQDVAKYIDITCDSMHKKLVVSSEHRKLNINRLFEKAKGLEEWTSVKVSDLKDGVFTVSF